MCQRAPGHKGKAEMDKNGSLWEQNSEGGRIVAVDGWFFIRWIYIMVSFFKLYSYITLHKNTKVVIKMFRKRHLISDMSVSSFHSVNLLPILIPVASPEPQIYLLSDRISLYLVTTILGVRKSCSVNQTTRGQTAVHVLVDLFGEMDNFHSPPHTHIERLVGS